MTDINTNDQLTGHDHLERFNGEVNHPTVCGAGFRLGNAPRPKEAGIAPLATQIYPQANTNFSQEISYAH
jgi:hypothetical protein